MARNSDDFEALLAKLSVSELLIQLQAEAVIQIGFNSRYLWWYWKIYDVQLFRSWSPNAQGNTAAGIKPGISTRLPPLIKEWSRRSAISSTVTCCKKLSTVIR